mmetsp:Transcript_52942/g.124022  ORF Transcript_52942/g.124022 Transcript_52942/m.124022 type:complete len:249 (-) Transcript_52942:271-1017(-)
MARQPSLFLLAALIATLRHVHGATFVDPTINVALGDPHAGGVRLEMPSHPMFQQTRQENPSSESVTLSEGGSKEDVAVNVMTAKDARKTSAVPTAETVPIYFSLAGIPEVQDVTVCGSWSAWMDHYKLAKQGDDFDGVIDLPVGKHTFKFIVDGDWTTSSQWPITYDQDGQTNNVIDVAPPQLQKGVALRKFHNEAPDHVAPTPAKSGVGSVVKSLMLFPFKAVGEVISLLLTPFKLILGLFGGKKQD